LPGIAIRPESRMQRLNLQEENALDAQDTPVSPYRAA
jgi:hypothetical protein